MQRALNFRVLWVHENKTNALTQLNNSVQDLNVPSTQISLAVSNGLSVNIALIMITCFSLMSLTNFFFSVLIFFFIIATFFGKMCVSFLRHACRGCVSNYTHVFSTNHVASCNMTLFVTFICYNDEVPTVPTRLCPSTARCNLHTCLFRESGIFIHMKITLSRK